MMVVETLACILALAPPAPIPVMTPPPQPDFATPVDYLAWFEKQRAPLRASNALDMYGTFLYGRDRTEAPNLAPQYGSAAQHALTDVLTRLQEWQPADQPELAQWMDGVIGRYGNAYVAADQRQFYCMRSEPNWTLLADVKTPAIGNGRLIGQAMLAKGWCLEGNALYAERIRGSLKANFVFARQLSCGMTLEEQFLAIGHRAALYRALQRMLPSNYLFANFWRDVDGYLATYDNVSVTRSYARSLYFSEAATYQLLQHLCTTDGDDGKLSPVLQQARISEFFATHPDRVFNPDALKALREADPRSVAKAAGEYFRGMTAMLEQDHVSRLADRVATLEKDVFDREPALRAVVTPVGLAVQSAFRTEAQRRLARVFIHLAADFKTSRTWPESLDAIKDPAVRSVLTDPLSGETLRMVPLGSRLLLYSVGPNGVDDGGSPSKDATFSGVVSREPLAAQRSEQIPVGVSDPTQAVKPADRPEAERD